VGTVKLVHRAQYEISIDGVPRSYRDRQDIAIQTARFLKSRNPHSVVKLKDLQTGEETVVAFKSEQECLSSCARPALVHGVYKEITACSAANGASAASTRRGQS
jgi:hypothetical protein